MNWNWQGLGAVLETYALAIPLIAVLVGLLASWTLFRAPKDQESAQILNWRTAMFVMVLATFTAVMQLNLDVQQAKEAAAVVSSARTVRVMSDYVTTRQTLYSKSVFLGELYTQQFDKFSKVVDDARDDRIFVGGDELPRIAIKMIASARTSVRATSYVDESGWWRSLWSKLYIDENRSATQRGVHIERIFLFPNRDAFERDQDILKDNLKAGVDVRYVFVDQLSEPFTRDVINVDDTVGSILDLDNRAIRSIEFTSRLESINETLAVVEARATKFAATDSQSTTPAHH